MEACNYRPIALTIISRRVYERVILSRIKHKLELLHRSQGGFRPQRSTLDQCFSLDEIIKKYPSSEHAFLDIKAAFDSVNRQILWSNLVFHFPTLITLQH